VHRQFNPWVPLFGLHIGSCFEPQCHYDFSSQVRPGHRNATYESLQHTQSLLTRGIREASAHFTEHLDGIFRASFFSPESLSAREELVAFAS